MNRTVLPVPSWLTLRFLWLSGLVLFTQALVGQSDSVRLDQMNTQLNEEFEAGNNAKALEILRKMRQFSLSRFNPDTILQGNLERGFTHVFHSLGENDSAIAYAQQALQTFLRLQGPMERETIDVEYDLAYVFNSIFAFDSAVYHYKQCIEKYEAVLGDTTDDLPLTHHNLAILYKDFNLQEQAHYHEKLAYDMWLRLYGPKHHRIFSASNSLANLSLSIGKREAALLFQQQAMDIALEIFTDKPGRIAMQYLSLSGHYREYGNPAQREFYLEKGTKLLEETPNSSPRQLASMYHAWGKYYQEEEDFTAAAQSLAKAIQTLGPSPTQHGAKIQSGDYHTTYAQILKQMGKYEDALQLLDTAQAYYLEVFPHRAYFTYFEQADNYFFLKDTTAFFAATRKMLAYFLQEPKASTLSFRALFQRDIVVYPEVNPIKVLSRTADRFWEIYQQSRDPYHLELTRLFFEQLDRWYGPQLEGQYRLNQMEAQLRSNIHEGLLRVYADPQYVARHGLENAFAASEDNKAFSLLRHLRQQSLPQFMGLPDSITQQDASMRAQIDFLTAKMSRSILDGETETYAQREVALLKLKRQHEVFTTQLEDRYPQYTSLIEPEPLSLSQLQQSLEADQHALIFSRVDSVLYTFHLSQDQQRLEAIPLANDISEQIERYRDLLFTVSAPNSKHQDSLQRLGADLYQQLLAPVLESNTRPIASLLLVPDDVLSFLPFEVLHPVPTDDRYLLHDMAVSYALSARLYHQQLETEKQVVSGSLVAIAPSYQQEMLASLDQQEAMQMRGLVREGWYDLAGAKGEAQAIVSGFNGDLILGDAARKDTFLAIAEDYQILHLAMHASVKPQTPLLSSLVFSAAAANQDSSERFLYATDLLRLRLNAEMVVLSACNTGYGKIERGEGAESLAKSFHYAGSPAVVMSLWKVPDRETSIIMQAFYHYLKTGHNKSAALRQAKLDYLAQVKAPELAHPFFWAGFVLSGNTTPLTTEPPLPWKGLWTGGLLVVLAGLWFARRKVAAQA